MNKTFEDKLKNHEERLVGLEMDVNSTKIKVDEIHKILVTIKSRLTWIGGLLSTVIALTQVIF